MFWPAWQLTRLSSAPPLIDDLVLMYISKENMELQEPEHMQGFMFLRMHILSKMPGELG